VISRRKFKLIRRCSLCRAPERAVGPTFVSSVNTVVPADAFDLTGSTEKDLRGEVRCGKVYGWRQIPPDPIREWQGTRGRLWKGRTRPPGTWCVARASGSGNDWGSGAGKELGHAMTLWNAGGIDRPPKKSDSTRRRSRWVIAQGLTHAGNAETPVTTAQALQLNVYAGVSWLSLRMCHARRSTQRRPLPWEPSPATGSQAGSAL